MVPIVPGVLRIGGIGSTTDKNKAAKGMARVDRAENRHCLVAFHIFARPFLPKDENAKF